MSLLFVLVAGILASFSNFFLRRSIDAGGSSRGYLVVQLSFSFCVMILLNPVRTNNYIWNNQVVVLGLIGGALLGFLMWGLGKTLEKGPAGLSFAVLNVSTVMPAIVLFLLFGPFFGHPYTITNGLGSALVVLGLFWAGWSAERNPNKGVWISFAILIFVVHTLFLVYLQWWALVLKNAIPETPLVPFHINPFHVQWFMPAVFFSGALIQILVYLSKEKKMPNRAEITYGVLGGVANGLCTFFLILAPQFASAWENAMLFPIFSVSIIIICNAWAQILYKEKVNWKANTLCVLGLLIGTITWSAFIG